MAPLGHCQTKTLPFFQLWSLLKCWYFFSPPEIALPKLWKWSTENSFKMNRLLKGKDRWGDCGILPGWRSVLNLNFECWARRSHPCTGTHLHPEAFIYIHIHTHPPSLHSSSVFICLLLLKRNIPLKANIYVSSDGRKRGWKTHTLQVPR